MKGKASDICTKCKHCEGLDMFAKMYSCKHYNNYPDAAIGMDSEIDCCNFEEVTMNKVKGKVSDWCPKCKNCKGTTKESNGVHVWLTEVECEDPYDGMIKTLAADSDVCCSMFEVRKEKEPFNLNMSREQLELKILDLFEEKDRLNGIINNLEKEKAAHMKGIERLKKSQEKLQNQVKNLQTTNEESYKREEKLEDKVRKLERRLLEERNNNQFDTISEMNKKIGELESRKEECEKKYRDEISKLQNIVTEREVKIRDLWRDNVYLNQNRLFGDEAMKKNTKLNQTISDQEITIKALLITIKEMCKEDETNE